MSVSSFCGETKQDLQTVPLKNKCCRDALAYGFALFSDKTEGEEAIDTARFVCPGCTVAFLRGAFVACGTVSDPRLSYHLEFSVSGEPLARSLADCLGEQQLAPPKIVYRPRRRCFGLYYKDSEAISDLLAYLGAQNAAFALINTKILRDLRNEANRHTNCDAANIGKTVTAATGQMNAIYSILESGKADLLSSELRETLDLRAAHPDANLEQLAALHTPPLTKSGVYHRLRKIREFAENEESEPS